MALDRREMLGGTVLAGSGLQVAAAPPSAIVPAGASVVEDLVSLATNSTRADALVYLAQPGREGFFRRHAGPGPAGDPLRGLVVPTSQGDHYARIWDGLTGRPEWFGAVVNDGRADCAAAIEACVAACPVTQFAQADYFIRRTLALNHSFRSIRGSGTYAADQGQGTRIILQGSAPGIHDVDVLLLGSRTQPGRDSASFPHEIHLSDLTLIRDGAAAPHPTGDLRRYPAGLRASFLTRCTVARIASLDSAVGFYLGGLVYTKIDDCLAQRLRAGTGGGDDFSVGYFLDGSPDFGLAGGNASLYVNRCLAVGQHARHVRPTGLVAEGAFVDSFIDAFESARIDYGMRFSARGAGKLTQTIDLHVRNCVFDGCGGTGLEIDLAGTQSASVEVIDPYVYAGGQGGVAGIVVHNGGGLVTMTGGQVHGDFRDGSLLLRRTRGVRVQGLKLHEGSRPVVIAASGALQLEPQVMNLTRRGGFAIDCADMYRSAIRPMVLGAPGMLAGGVSLNAACDFSSVDVAAVDPGCFASATATRKVVFAGHDAARGVGAVAFAKAGNVVVGAIG